MEANELGFTADDYNNARPRRASDPPPLRPRQLRWWAPVAFAASSAAAYTYLILRILGVA